MDHAGQDGACHFAVRGDQVHAQKGAGFHDGRHFQPDAAGREIDDLRGLRAVFRVAYLLISRLELAGEARRGALVRQRALPCSPSENLPCPLRSIPAKTHSQAPSARPHRAPTAPRTQGPCDWRHARPWVFPGSAFDRRRRADPPVSWRAPREMNRRPGPRRDYPARRPPGRLHTGL